ncbi:unnamed protein product [Lathyrus sativus]|nr:unnamed protein product [Lathyrus sativus]
MVNLDKSEASFSRNMLDSIIEMIPNMMSVKIVQSHSRYMGLPVLFGRSKKEFFSLMIDRVWKKLKGWKEIVLSWSGKEVFIKVAAQAIMLYIMRCFKLPEGVCRDIESMMSKFWWGSTSREGERKLHWFSW